jgi:hypothetical protein
MAGATYRWLEDTLRGCNEVDVTRPQLSQFLLKGMREP